MPKPLGMESDRRSSSYRFAHLGATGRRSAAAGEIRVLAYNIYMRPEILFGDNQEVRARLLPAHLSGYDVIIFSEAFDDSIRQMIVSALSGEYRWRSSVVGSDFLFIQDGGVIILSHWPIETSREELFGSVCSGSDYFADKGVMYVRINKRGQRYHIFGTHTDAGNEAGDREARQGQFQIIRQLISEIGIPSNQPVLIGGDLNVDRYHSGEYQAMLSTLHADSPPLSRLGPRYTFDPARNRLAEGPHGEFLDYVLYSTDHLRPSRALLTALTPQTPWADDDEQYQNLSDHYALLGEFDFSAGAAGPP